MYWMQLQSVIYCFRNHILRKLILYRNDNNYLHGISDGVLDRVLMNLLRLAPYDPELLENWTLTRLRADLKPRKIKFPANARRMLQLVF